MGHNPTHPALTKFRFSLFGFYNLFNYQTELLKKNFFIIAIYNRSNNLFFIYLNILTRFIMGKFGLMRSPN